MIFHSFVQYRELQEFEDMLIHISVIVMRLPLNMNMKSV